MFGKRPVPSTVIPHCSSSCTRWRLVLLVWGDTFPFIFVPKEVHRCVLTPLLLLRGIWSRVEYVIDSWSNIIFMSLSKVKGLLLPWDGGNRHLIRHRLEPLRQVCVFIVTMFNFLLRILLRIRLSHQNRPVYKSTQWVSKNSGRHTVPHDTSLSLLVLSKREFLRSFYISLYSRNVRIEWWSIVNYP